MNSQDAARTLQHNATAAQKLLWSALRVNQVDGLHSRPQYPVGGYFTDFYRSARKLAVEVDGSIHAEPSQREYDAARDATIARFDITVLRVSNEEVLNNLPAVITRIRAACHSQS